MMKLLPPSARHHILAAEGWLELGNLEEAAAELDELPPRLRAHPDVLAVRCQIFGRAGNFDACLDLAAAVTKLAPERFSSWGVKANVLRKLGRTEEGRDVLLSVVRKFENDWQVHYELSRFCCLLNRVEEARAWFGKAMDQVVGAAALKKFKLMAMEEPDLGVLWK